MSSLITNPAFVAVIRELTTTEGGTLLTLIKTSSSKPIFTPENCAVIQRLTGTKYKKIKTNTVIPTINNAVSTILSTFFN